MNPAAAGRLWKEYRLRDVIRQIHPDDQMYRASPENYWTTGESAAHVICGALVSAHARGEVRTVMDYGCGHGRVGRHLRALFPSAGISFCDRLYEAAQFCAEAFNGKVVAEDMLPKKNDLVWVGSVFTHLDWKSSQALFSKLADSLSQHGVIVATFLGRKGNVLRREGQCKYIGDDKWARISEAAKLTGFGYENYEDATDYGISLSSPARVIELGASSPNLRLISYTEAGWGWHQDVAAWAASPLDPRN